MLLQTEELKNKNIYLNGSIDLYIYFLILTFILYKTRLFHILAVEGYFLSLLVRIVSLYLSWLGV